MNKYNMLGLVNFLLGAFFLFIIIKSYYVVPLTSPVFILIKAYWSDVILALLFLGNCFFAYKLLIKKEKKYFSKYLLSTVSIVFCFVVLFVVGLVMSSSAPPDGYQSYQENISNPK